MVPVHPFIHRIINACFSNVDLEGYVEDVTPLETSPEIARFLLWIARKPPDFDAPSDALADEASMRLPLKGSAVS